MPRKVVRVAAPAQTGPLTAKLLGEFVRAKRTRENLRLEDAAMLCGVAKDTLFKIEKAKGGVRFESVLQVCQKLGVRLMVEPWEEDANG